MVLTKGSNKTPITLCTALFPALPHTLYLDRIFSICERYTFDSNSLRLMLVVAAITNFGVSKLDKMTGCHPPYFQLTIFIRPKGDRSSGEHTKHKQ